MTTEAKLDVYGIITSRVIEQLEKGTVPWLKPWAVRGVRQSNFVSKKAYRGVNVFLLEMAGYGCPCWVTFKQAAGLGGSVKKGEHGTPVVFWNWVESKTEKDSNGRPKKIPFLRYYTVFNLSQTEGIEWTQPEAVTGGFTPLEEAEQIVAGYLKAGPVLRHGGDVACYSPALDAVNMPERAQFTSPAGYYSTLFHELAHSTGHQSRLARPGITEVGRFGSEHYGKEELVAEMGAAFLDGLTGLESHVEQSAAYIANWLKALKDDRKLVVLAAAQAQKAADLILAGEGQGEDGWRDENPAE